MSVDSKIICETQRLYLRELTAEDAQFAYDLNSNPEVLKYTGDVAFESKEEAATFLFNYPQYRKYGFGRWAVVRKDNDVILGWCGLKYDEDRREHDIGYRFFESYWGQGYASEAAEVCVRLAFERFGITVLHANAHSDNFASHRVLQKIGLQQIADCGRTPDEFRFVLTKKMWLQKCAQQ